MGPVRNFSPSCNTSERLMAKYKPAEWNQFRDVSLRTNNLSEAFHAAFSRRFAWAHPNVRVMIDALKTSSRKQESPGMIQHRCTHSNVEEYAHLRVTPNHEAEGKCGRETSWGFLTPCRESPSSFFSGLKRSSSSTVVNTWMCLERHSTMRS